MRQARPCSTAAVPWLSLLQAVAEDQTESSRGLLGHFSSTQMHLIESLFVSMGEPDPWGFIINPIWAAFLVDVEEAWNRATEPSPDLTSGEPTTGLAEEEQARLPSAPPSGRVGEALSPPFRRSPRSTS